MTTTPKPHINDVLHRKAKPVPRIELHQTPTGWQVHMINHKHQHRCGRDPEPKHEAFALAKELKEFLDWPLEVVR